MVSEREYAQLSAYTYRDVRGDANKPLLPAGWDVLQEPDGIAGFRAAVFKKGMDIVIGYEGTNPDPISLDGLQDWYTNLSAATGSSWGQVQAAALLYEQIGRTDQKKRRPEHFPRNAK